MSDKAIEPADDGIAVGRISGVYGVRGWVKIFSYTQPRENILKYSPWDILRQGQWQTVNVEEGKAHGKGVIARLENCTDRDQAYALIGTEISVSRQQLPSLAQGEYYWRDLIGLLVVNTQGDKLGQVEKLMETGANDVLVVAGEREYLIPYVMGNTVLHVDIDKGELLVDWDRSF
ncbi:MAG: ribosome maturation factor RimM [Gammaproteobacteria bacterium]